ncbi:MAG TPA: hypothetical protein DD727_09450 [Clostridiales bacterium]|nr:hypothetical protein [Clostridiales bacterium]
MRRLILLLYRLTRRRLFFPLLVAMTLLGMLIAMELKHPWYFLQDDNRDYYLPYFSHAYNALVRGEIPLFNFHQFMGHPFLAVGQTGALYPPVYLAVALSRLLFGHIYAAIDIEVTLHLMLGGLGFYFLLSYLCVRPRAAFMGAITWCFSSMIIITSGSWVIVSGAAAWFPWMAYLTVKVVDKASDPRRLSLLSDAAFLVVVRLMLFYQGNVQYFIYACLFEILLAFTYSRVILRRKIPRKKVWIAGAGTWISTLSLSLPLLLPMWRQMNDSALRSAALPFEDFAMEVFDIGQWLTGLVYPFLEMTEEMIWAYRRHVNLTFVGYAMLLLFLAMSARWIAALIGWLRHRKHPERRLDPEEERTCRLYVLALIPGIIAFLMSASYLVNYILYRIPILNRFRFPFKIQVFTVFFIIIGGCAGWQWLNRRFAGRIRHWVRSLVTLLLIAVQLGGFAALYLAGPHRNFGNHRDPLPLSEPLAEVFGTDRFLSTGFNLYAPKDFDYRGFDTFTAHTLGFNYATLFGMNQFAGYEQLVSRLNDEKCLWMNNWAIYDLYSGFRFYYTREMGVRWYVVASDNTEDRRLLEKQPGISLWKEEERRAIYEDRYAAGMVMVTNAYGSRLDKAPDFLMGTNTITVKGLDQLDFRDEWMEFDEYGGMDGMEDTPVLAGERKITLNYLYHPFFKAETTRGEPVLITADSFGRMTATIPDGCDGITFRYEDPLFRAGVFLAGSFLALLVLAGLILRGISVKHSAKKQVHDIGI